MSPIANIDIDFMPFSLVIEIMSTINTVSHKVHLLIHCIYRITAVMKVEIDIIASIATSGPSKLTLLFLSVTS